MTKKWEVFGVVVGLVLGAMAGLYATWHTDGSQLFGMVVGGAFGAILGGLIATLLWADEMAGS